MRLAAAIVVLVLGCTPTLQIPQSAVSPSAAPIACRQPWTDGLRRPERFTLVAECVVLEATVRHVKAEADGDLHVQVLPDPPADQYLNDRNRAAQSGALVMEIEPWQHGKRSGAVGAAAVNEHKPSAYCTAACEPKPGDRVRVVSPIVTDNEPGHGWNEAHSPSDVALLGHVEPPSMVGIEHPSDEDTDQ